ncbi:hypothetical protein WJX74_007274 [Apatococcus lobatus]|uniref:Small-subunit processome Utp12 domain-containing protein n=1 Tax=Apatococcus lobatus TaxID=904363 RepID=A0AAW1S3A0_9CHLO
MVKAYLRYELTETFGVVASNSNLSYDTTGKQVFTACLESLAVWNVKQGSQVRRMTPPPSVTSRAAAEIVRIASSPSGPQLAAGHADGTVRLWNHETAEGEVSLTGHKGAVTALCYSQDGALLASGSQDTDVVVWDVVGEMGLFRLRGHLDQVTDLVFLDKGKQLVSSSKDGYIRVWQTESQHCSQSILMHRGEVWALALDAAETRLMVGTAEQQLHVYTVQKPSAETTLPLADGHEHAPKRSKKGSAKRKAQAEDPEDGDEMPQVATANRGGSAGPSSDTLHFLGQVKRPVPDRVAGLSYNKDGQLLACQCSGKAIEIYRVKSSKEAQQRMRRRKKRRREKARKGTQGEAEADGVHANGNTSMEDGDAAETEIEEDVVEAADELILLQVIRLKSKVRGVAFKPGKLKAGVLGRLCISLSNNSLEVWDISEGDAKKGQVVEGQGHRTDARAVAISSDDSLLISASGDQAKIWNPRTATCLRTIDTGYGLCAVFVPGNRHAIVGTKAGTLDILDIGASECIESKAAHTGAIWTLALLPDNSGLVSGSADHDIKFWEWQVMEEDGSGLRQLSLAHTRTLKMTDDVLCIRISPNGKLLAAALLDSTIKVFFLDSLKFFLSLYGHKLPVLTMDVSSDSHLLVSGSADKNIKIWGLDFGDCHRSLFAHGDSVMQVAFVRNTHYVFTVGKDRLVKYWDVDKFQLLLELPGHQAEVWAVVVSSLGDFVVTASHDRSFRRWERTEEPFFIEEEQERRLESLFEADAEDRVPKRKPDEAGHDEVSVGRAGRKTAETLNATDRIIEALELAGKEAERLQEHETSTKADKELEVNPFLLGLDASAFVLKSISDVRASDVEQALLLIPFTDALRLLSFLPIWLSKRTHVELACRVAVLLVRLHHSQLVATPAARPVMIKLQGLLHSNIQGLRDTIGFNLAALQYLQRRMKSKHATMGGEAQSVPIKRLSTPASVKTGSKTL